MYTHDQKVKLQRMIVFAREKKDLLIESHLFDFDEFIYGANIKIEFIERIRSEKKFDSVEELIENIKKDVEFAKKLFTKDDII